MKKILTILFILLTTTCLVACSDNTSQTTTNNKQEESENEVVPTYTEIEITADNFFDYFTYEMGLTPYIDDFGDKKYYDHPGLIISIKDEYKNRLYYYDGETIEILREHISEIPTLAIEYNIAITYEKANIDTNNGTIEWTGDIQGSDNENDTKKMYFYTLNGDPSYMNSDNSISISAVSEGGDNYWYGKVTDLQIVRAKGTIKLKNN